MKLKISEYGISAEELGFTVKPITVYTKKLSGQKIVEATSDKKPVEPKYAGPEGKNGQAVELLLNGFLNTLPMAARKKTS